MDTQVTVAVIYYSSTGNVFELAKAAVTAAEEAGAEVRLRKVRELASAEAIALNEGWSDHAVRTRHIAEAAVPDLDWADAILFGAPNRYGLPAAQLKQFIDTTEPLWAQGRLVNKVCSSFTSTGTAYGGQESTILAINNTFYHWGALIVPPGYGYAEPVQFQTGNPYGASHVSQNGEVSPGPVELASMSLQTRRVVDVAKAMRVNRLA